MKYVKLFEEFLSEEDPLGDLLGGGEEGGDGKAKEDPLDAEKKKQKAKEEKAQKKHEKMMDKKEETIEDILNKYPEMKEKIGEKILTAIQKSDRVLIHNAVNDVIYLQQKYQENGEYESVDALTKVKDILDKLDRSFTVDKRL